MMDSRVQAVCGLSNNTRLFALLDDAAISEHNGPIAHHANDIEVVAYKQEGQARRIRRLFVRRHPG
jgi:hypothetical protein